MYRSNQFLAKVKATSTGKLLDSPPRNDGAAELCSITRDKNNIETSKL
jgi:hypothetical protein